MSSNPFIIGIAGASGSGKSTLATHIKKKYSEKVEVIHFDDYQKEEKEVPLLENMRNWDHPDAIDFEKLLNDIKKLKNKEEVTEKAKWVYRFLQKHFTCQYDESGTIGRRYRRQDEIGTPFCITVDFDTLEKDGIEIISNILRLDKSKIYRNLHYNGSELDGLIPYDDALFIIEAKAGKLSDSARRGSIQSFMSDMEVISLYFCVILIK